MSYHWGSCVSKFIHGSFSWETDIYYFHLHTILFIKPLLIGCWQLPGLNSRLNSRFLFSLAQSPHLTQKLQKSPTNQQRLPDTYKSYTVSQKSDISFLFSKADIMTGLIVQKLSEKSNSHQLQGTLNHTKIWPFVCWQLSEPNNQQVYLIQSVMLLSCTPPLHICTSIWPEPHLLAICK